jgi:hypothetical protein
MLQFEKKKKTALGTLRVFSWQCSRPVQGPSQARNLELEHCHSLPSVVHVRIYRRMLVWTLQLEIYRNKLSSSTVMVKTKYKGVRSGAPWFNPATTRLNGPACHAWLEYEQHELILHAIELV